MRCTTLGLLWLPSVRTGSRAALTRIHLSLNIRAGKGRKMEGLSNNVKKEMQ